jgi:ferredoxin
VTPFRLRERLRRVWTAGPADDAPVEVEFVLPDGSTGRGRGEARYTLVMASQNLATPIATGCPDGGCGGCSVEILAGVDALAAPSDAEVRSFEQRAGRKPSPTERLACHARVMRTGARVRVSRVWSLEDQKGA